MLNAYPLDTMLATNDAAQAKAWYADKLGWEPSFEDPNAGILMYKPAGSTVTIYQTPNAGSARNTVAIWNVKDLPAAMSRLRDNGVTFEDYDFGDFKTVDGVATEPEDGSMNSWFKDLDGNTWSLFFGPDDERPERIGPMLAASDLDRSKRWWSEKLGYAPEVELDGVINVYASGGRGFSIYSTQFAGTAKNTVAGWQVDDLRAEMVALRARGVVFEEYDFGDFKTVDGVMTDPNGFLAAWLTDSEGNILSLTQTAAETR